MTTEACEGAYTEIDGKYVWASEEEIAEARAGGLLDEESLAELKFGGGSDEAE